jgi:hypothetical protein
MSDYTGPGGTRTRRRPERCERQDRSRGDVIHEYVPPDYVAKRIEIEQSHDDGTAMLVARDQRQRAIYNERDPINERSPIVVLRFFGATERDTNTLERNGCEHVYDVRDACRRDNEIPSWAGCGTMFRDRVRRIIRDFDEVMNFDAAAWWDTRMGEQREHSRDE